LKAELGKFETCAVELENPSNLEAEVHFKISNIMNFDVSPNIIRI
jgi:hypothetical protein